MIVKSMRRRIFTAIAILALISVVSGTALAVGYGHLVKKRERTANITSSEFAPVQYTSKVSTQADQALERLSPQDVLTTVVRRMGPTSIVGMRIGSPPASAMEAGAPASARWAYFTVKSPTVGPEANRGAWEANLAAAVVRDVLHQRQIALLGVSLAVELPSGETVDVREVGVGNVVHGQVFGAEAPSTITANMRALAEARGFEVRKLDVLIPRQAAPALVVSTRDAGRAVADADDTVGELFGAAGKYEGIYLEIRDEAGELVLVRGTSYRSGGNQFWIRPDLDPRRTASSAVQSPTGGAG